MPENNKEIVEHLKRIEYLLAGILLGRKPNIKEVAKAIKCSDNTLTSIFPEKGKGKKGKNDSGNTEEVTEFVEVQETKGEDKNAE